MQIFAALTDDQAGDYPDVDTERTKGENRPDVTGRHFFLLRCFSG